ncbi:MAG: hypothetical protein OXJ55_18550 [Caldilineaceae bacterium]|nr:hypothetical protein [Caldilineaceae bacterium]
MRCRHSFIQSEKNAPVRAAYSLQERQAMAGRAGAAVVFLLALIVTRVFSHLDVIIVSV